MRPADIIKEFEVVTAHVCFWPKADVRPIPVSARWRGGRL